MRNWLGLFCFALLACLWGAAPLQAAGNTVLVLPFQVTAGPEMPNAARDVPQIIGTEMQQRGLSVIPMDNARSLLSSRGGSIDMAAARELGTKAGADLVLFGSFKQNGEGFALQSLLVPVNEGQAKPANFDRPSLLSLNECAAAMAGQASGMLAGAAAAAPAPSSAPRTEPTDPIGRADFVPMGTAKGALADVQVRGLQVMDSRLFVLLPSCGERIALDADFPQTGTDTFAYSAEAQPYRMLSADTYINTEGRVCALDGTALLDTGLNTPAAGLTVLTDDSVFWASNSSTVPRASLTGNDAADFPVNGILKALTATAAVTYRDGAFYRTPYREFAARPTPTPTASASPTSYPAPDSGLTFRDGCLFAPEGMTCAGLRDVLAPREAQIYTENMAPASGRLKTGLTALVDGTPYTVVVPGDINGSGTVNSADLRLLQRHLADDEPLDSDALFAADLNADGVADAADLVLLSARIGA